MAARPRGGDWLCGEMAAWRANGVDTVVSLLELPEEEDLALQDEAAAARAQGMRYRSFPVADRQVPESRVGAVQLLEALETELKSGRNLAIHCRQGVGRTGLVAAGLLVLSGMDPIAAVERLSAARGVAVPETEAQVSWINEFAETSAVAR